MAELLTFLGVAAYYLLTLCWWVVFIAVIFQLLIQFGVINTYNDFVRGLHQALYSVTEPVFARVRRMLPATGNIDLSPLIVLLGITMLQMFINIVYLPNVAKLV